MSSPPLPGGPDAKADAAAGPHTSASPETPGSPAVEEPAVGPSVSAALSPVAAPDGDRPRSPVTGRLLWSRRALWLFALGELVVGLGLVTWSVTHSPTPSWGDALWALGMFAAFHWVGRHRESYEGNFNLSLTGPLVCVAAVTLPPALAAVAVLGHMARRNNWRTKRYRNTANIGLTLTWMVPLTHLAHLMTVPGPWLPGRALAAGVVSAVACEIIPFAVVRFAVLREVGKWGVPWSQALPGWAGVATYTFIGALAVVTRDAGSAWPALLVGSVLSWQLVLRSHARLRHQILLAEQERAQERADLTQAMLRQSEVERTLTMAALHDGVLQSLLVAHFRAEMHLEEVGANGPPEHLAGPGALVGARVRALELALAQERAQQERAWTEHVAELGDLGRQLRALMRVRGGPGAGHLDLPEALADAATLLRSALVVHLDVDSLPAGTDPGAQRAVFDVVRQAMENAAQHSGGENLWVSVRAQESELVADVVDDGAGPVPESLDRPLAGAGQLGVALMLERAATHDGHVSVQLRDGGLQGTHVRVRVPVRDEGPDPAGGHSRT